MVLHGIEVKKKIKWEFSTLKDNQFGKEDVHSNFRTAVC